MTDFYIAIPSMPKSDFEQYSMHLFDEWEGYMERTSVLSDYSLALEVEEGSIKGAGRIAAALGILYIGIGNYGSFISGLQTIKSQISMAGDFLSKRAVDPFDAHSVKSKVHKRGGTLAALQRLFTKVQRGEITPDQAMREAEALLGEEAQAVPEFMRKLGESLNQAPRFHKQLPLPLATQEEVPMPTKERERMPRQLPSQPGWQPSSQFRIEVWRESKKTKRNIRVVEL